MLRSYVTVALRNLRRHAGYAFVNIAGLALGIAVCVLILLYVRDELTYDHFHARADDIYLTQLQQSFADHFIVTQPPIPMGAALIASSPDVENAVHVHDPGRIVVERDDVRFYEEELRYTDPSFFDVFDLPLLRGDPQTALARPNTVVLTPDAARTYFGDADPIGQTLRVGDRPPLEVTGVLQPLPSNTSLSFQLLASLASLRGTDLDLDSWSSHGGNTDTYLLLRAGADTSRVAQQMTALIAREADRLAPYRPVLTPLKALHLHGLTFEREGTLGGNIRYVYIFSGIALLVLLIACINFTNLTTAQAVRRAREVGVRKVVGAGRAQLVVQFLGETFLFSLAAVLAATALVELVLPGFNGLVEKELRVTYAGAGSVVPWLAALWVGAGVLAGTYPAFVLSAFRPMVVLKGLAGTAASGTRLRKVLVVVQFTVSIALIVSLLVVDRQLAYLQQHTLGMQPDQVILLSAHEQAGTNYAAFKDELRKLPGVTGVALANYPQAIGLPTTPEGQDRQTYVSTLVVDADFFELLRLELAAGRFLSASQPSDVDGAVLVNEAAVRAFGWTEPLGRRVERYALKRGEMTPSAVVGVVKDFPVGSLKQPIGPLVIVLGDGAGFLGADAVSVLVRLEAGTMPETLAGVQATWDRFAPAHPFTYQFLDARFEHFYRAERRLGHLFAAFAGLAVLIACLGLFGLAVYTAERRTKEIGIRKVMGASVRSVVVLLTREYALLVLTAFAIAAPLAYVAMQRWLEDYAFRIEMSAWTFVLAGLTTLFVAVATVSYQALRAALADPVKALRYE